MISDLNIIRKLILKWIIDICLFNNAKIFSKSLYLINFFNNILNQYFYKMVYGNKKDLQEVLIQNN